MSSMTSRHGNLKRADTLSILIDESFVILNDEWKDFYVVAFDNHIGIFQLPQSAKETFHPLDNEPLQILLGLSIDRIEVSRSRSSTFKLGTSQCTWRFKARNDRERDRWIECIAAMKAEEARGASFAPMRDRTHFQTYVDGKEYFAAVANALRTAKEEVFIAGWYLCPEIFLDRSLFPPSQDSRLDNLLQTVAMQGVSIYILLYSEVQFTLNLRSSHAKKHLESLHPNIYVIAHGPSMKSIYYAHHQKFVVIDRELAFVGGIDLAIGRYDDQKYSLTDINGEVYIGADYYNPEVAVPLARDSHFHDTIDRKQWPRMPWHDIQCSVDGGCASDIALNFIQRWNDHNGATPEDLITFVRTYPLLFPIVAQTKASSYAHMYAAPPSGVIISCTDTQCMRQHGNTHVIRSLGPWSGTPVMESSINDKMVSMILGAQHIIYIENQYFISTPNPDVQNPVGQALITRISSAIDNKETFRVVILTNVHSEGDFRNDKSIRALMHHQFRTLSRGNNSIIKILEHKYPSIDISNYISVFTLRAHGTLEGKTVTSPIYVHAKLTIVDDREMIISSANVNDRSLIGDRDSELGVYIQDGDLGPGTMNGVQCQVGRNVQALRMRLWQTYLGLHVADTVCKDPVSSQVYHDLLKATAKNNTERFESCFHSIPSSRVYTFSELASSATPAKAPEQLQYICGYIIDFPHDFLKDEHLMPSFGDAEFLVDGKMYL